ncbi:MAG TPA: hypothetical protein VLA34_00910, partial [Candidatus Krumholzibacterium sp.]|nr:hypothetical protein [Candidatus Krumholzibacterium sp.]
LWSLKSWRDDICQQYSSIRGKLLDEHADGYILSGLCGLEASWDGCGSWDSVFGPDTVVNSIEIACDGMVYVATDHGLLRSPDGLGDFECVIEGEISPYALVAGYDGILFVGTGEGLLRTMDRGESWDTVVDTSYVNTVAFDSLGNVYAGIEGCVLFSADWGDSWEKIYFGGFNESPKTLLGSPCGRVLALTNHRKIYLMESGDTRWKLLDSSMPMHADFMTGDDGNIYIYDYQIFRYSIPLPDIRL